MNTCAKYQPSHSGNDPVTALIEHKSGYRLEREEATVAETLRANDQKFQIAALSQVRRGKVDATQASLVVGGLDFMAAALKQRDIELPVIESYPPALVDFLHRTIWRTTLCHVLDRIENGQGAVFVKPADRAKRFTGFVLDDSRDWRLQGVSRREPVLCSEPVAWLSEWRVYVVRGTVRFIANYDGDPSIGLARDQIEQAVRRMADAPGSPRSYAIYWRVWYWRGCLPGDAARPLEPANNCIREEGGFRPRLRQSAPGSAVWQWKTGLRALWQSLGCAGNHPSHPMCIPSLARYSHLGESHPQCSSREHRASPISAAALLAESILLGKYRTDKCQGQHRPPFVLASSRLQKSQHG